MVFVTRFEHTSQNPLASVGTTIDLPVASHCRVMDATDDANEPTLEQLKRREWERVRCEEAEEAKAAVRQAVADVRREMALIKVKKTTFTSRKYFTIIF